MIIVLMGPMGCGKTTIGELLSARLGWDFYDGDDYHPKENKQKMAQGVPLDDSDREPWLRVLNRMIVEHMEEGSSAILACSALKEKYRQILGIDQQDVVSVFLKGSQSVLRQHLVGRSHEYMSNDLLDSQLRTLEEPDSGIVVDVSGTPDQTVQEIVNTLGTYRNGSKTGGPGTQE